MKISVIILSSIFFSVFAVAQEDIHIKYVLGNQTKKFKIKRYRLNYYATSPNKILEEYALKKPYPGDTITRYSKIYLTNSLASCRLSNAYLDYKDQELKVFFIKAKNISACIICFFGVPADKRFFSSKGYIDGFFLENFPIASGVYFLNSYEMDKRIPFYSSCDKISKPDSIIPYLIDITPANWASNKLKMNANDTKAVQNLFNDLKNRKYPKELKIE